MPHMVQNNGCLFHVQFYVKNSDQGEVLSQPHAKYFSKHIRDSNIQKAIGMSIILDIWGLFGTEGFPGVPHTEGFSGVPHTNPTENTTNI